MSLGDCTRILEFVSNEMFGLGLPPAVDANMSAGVAQGDPSGVAEAIGSIGTAVDFDDDATARRSAPCDAVSGRHV